MARIVSTLSFIFILMCSVSAFAQTDSLSRQDSLILKAREAMQRYFDLRARSRVIMDSIEASQIRVKAEKKKSSKPKKTKLVPKNEPFRANDIRKNREDESTFLGAFYSAYKTYNKDTSLGKVLLEIQLFCITGLAMKV